ncbi:MAG: DUF5702 domain-containing protein [Dorea sp.]
MKRSQVKAQGFRNAKAEVTVYLSLIFILLISLMGALIESSSLQNQKNYKRALVNHSLECAFGEYQKELLEEYDIFALEGTYETGVYSEDQLFSRLDYYGEGNINHEIERIKFLSDDGASAFYEQAIRYMEHKYGLDAFQDKVGLTDLWKQQERNSKEYGKADEEYPISYLDELKKWSVLELVMPNGRTVSEKRIELSESLIYRDRQEGYGDFSDESEETGTLSKLLFGQYLLDHFTTAADEKDGNVLEYEVEYLITGKQSDRENLKAVVNQLLLFRFVPNYAYLQSNAAKKAEAEALALTLSTVLAVPMTTEAVAQMLLLAWAYGEAIMDLRTLLDGGKIPLTKTDDSWQLSLSSLLELKDNGNLEDGADMKNGLEYREYLRILLFLGNKDETAMHALDLIEQNMQKIHGLTFFKADQCISKIEIRSTCSLRRGITYQFSTYYGYN